VGGRLQQALRVDQRGFQNSEAHPTRVGLLVHEGGAVKCTPGSGEEIGLGLQVFRLGNIQRCELRSPVTVGIVTPSSCVA